MGVDVKQVEKEAKRILDKFSKALGGIEGEEGFVDRGEFDRGERKIGSRSLDLEDQGKECVGFKEKFLSNAPDSDGDFIIAEKGSWK
ncbi:hypothetical protein CMI42_02530 [Candidatus Pacearchaeota archaeon]|nr:hypothetical protein [Candidatus Pacearchaeota archaeon]|tara:strand:+ start:727 stop:987 length:261 start_codon:yes stop_codon:yes gene_type:complete